MRVDEDAAVAWAIAKGVLLLIYGSLEQFALSLLTWGPGRDIPSPSEIAACIDTRLQEIEVATESILEWRQRLSAD